MTCPVCDGRDPLGTCLHKPLLGQRHRIAVERMRTSRFWWREVGLRNVLAGAAFGFLLRCGWKLAGWLW